MIRRVRFASLGQHIWLSLFGKNIFALLVPWFVPAMAYLMIGKAYLRSWEYFLGGTVMVLGMTAAAFVPHDWVARYIAVRYPSITMSVKRALLTALVFCVLSGSFIALYTALVIRYKPFRAELSSEDLVYVYLFDLAAIFLLVCVYEVHYSIEKWKAIKVNKEAKKKASLQGQLQGLKSQVNPHFLFNSLNTLSALITEEPARAERFVDEMAKVYRYLLQTNQQELTTLLAEIRFIESYYHLLKTRYDSGLELNMEVSDAALNAMLPPLTLQLLVENAVKHNAILEKQPLRIDIRVLDGGLLEVRNTLQQRSSPVRSTGLGLANIRAKYLILSEKQPVIEVKEGYFRVLLPLITE